MGTINPFDQFAYQVDFLFDRCPFSTGDRSDDKIARFNWSKYRMLKVSFRLITTRLKGV